MSLIISPSEYQKQQHAKRVEAAIRQRDPSSVVLGSGLQRTGDLSEAAYDREVEYDISKYPKLAQEAKDLEDRARNARRVTSELLDEAQRQFELTKIAMAGQRWQGQERWQGHENEEARKVNILHCRVFVKKLAAAGVKVWLNDFTKLGRIGVNAKVVDPFSHKSVNKTVTTLHYPWGYEWSIMRFNEYDVPTQEKFRGWRTALLALILAGACTEKQAHKAFGEPSNTVAAEFYLLQLKNFREKSGMYAPSLDEIAQAAIAETEVKPLKPWKHGHPETERQKKKKRGKK